MLFLVRFILGFVLGCVLSVCALMLAGAGHGTYTPLTANAPVLAVIPDFGVGLALFGTPGLWAAYFLAIPEIRWRLVRLFIVAAVAVLHLGTAYWMSSRDEYFARMYNMNSSFMVFYFVLLSLCVVTLAVFAVVGKRPHKN